MAERTPHFLRGGRGMVECVWGAFPNPEELAFGGAGLPKAPLYMVKFRDRTVARRRVQSAGHARRRLMFSTTQQGLFLLSPLDGRVSDGIHTGEGFSMAPSVYGERAFIVSNGGRFYSFVIVPPT